MYRYCVDNAVTYTSEDLVLFRESPFACWVERLTLENPAHGIPPDLDTDPPGNSLKPQDELAETLRSEGKQVALVDWDAAEPDRRRETLEAMRQGIDFIVNGQLALGPLSGSANLLMRPFISQEVSESTAHGREEIRQLLQLAPDVLRHDRAIALCIDGPGVGRHVEARLRCMQEQVVATAQSVRLGL